MLIFIDSSRQASFIARHPAYRVPGARLLALTAEACQALDEAGLPYSPISELADIQPLRTAEPGYIQACLELARKIERYVGTKDPSARFEGPGFLSGQIYPLQFSLGAILTRVFLMRAAIQACSAKHVRVFAEDIDPWFAGSGYVRNPWLDALADHFHNSGTTVEIIELPVGDAESGAPASGKFAVLDGFAAWVKSRLKRMAFVRRLHLVRRLNRYPDVAMQPGLDGMRALFVGGSGYDWEPVIAAMIRNCKAECSVIRPVAQDEVGFRNHFASTVDRLLKSEMELDVPHPDHADGESYAGYFDEFVRSGGMTDFPPFLGIDLRASISPLLRALTGIGPGLARHADAIAEKILRRVDPQVACFMTISGLSERRLAFRCRERGIPVVCYQHGGGYGTHRVPSHGIADASDADYFLTYGTGILPCEMPALPVRARYVPVGSTRIQEMRRRAAPTTDPRSRQPIKVLWVADTSYRNTVAATCIVEDTARFRLQKNCLGILASGRDVRVVYRPFPFKREWQATPRWLSRFGPAGVTVDVSSPISSLISGADVVVVDSASNTVWDEIVALGKPMVVYCDPRMLRPHFAQDLERACRWCKSPDELQETIQRLASDLGAFMGKEQSAPREEFLRRYVLHDGECVSRVLSFMDQTCSGQKPSAA